MATSTGSRSLFELMAEAQAVASEAQQTFGDLSAQQINWKPSAAAWSIGQCFDHLIATNQGFFPTFDQIIKGEKKTTLWQRMPLLPGLWGKWLITSLSPDSRRKFKAPRSLQPSSSAIDPEIINRFAAHQQQVIGRMKATEGLDLERIIIYSPVSKLLTYSVLDAYTLIVTHERRHFGQARRVLESEGFPRR
jgi:uncharacterized damage-inducible protein DinB